MNGEKVRRLLAMVAAALVLSLVIFNVIPAGAAPRAPDPVLVTNGNSQAVPVSDAEGSLTVDGVVDAIVTNPSLPVTQSGTWNVGLTGTPAVDAAQSGTWNVGVTGTPSVQVFPTDPFGKRLDAMMEDGEVSVDESFIVPEGKRLVIEFVSARASVPNDQGLSFDLILQTISGESAILPAIPMTKTDFGTRDVVVGAEQTRLYTTPNSFVTCRFARSATAGETFAGCSLSGYMVDV